MNCEVGRQEFDQLRWKSWNANEQRNKLQIILEMPESIDYVQTYKNPRMKHETEQEIRPESKRQISEIQLRDWNALSFQTRMSQKLKNAIKN